MIIFPCCKINLGLNVVAERADGYHDIETVFYPIPLTDALEVRRMNENFPSSAGCDIKLTGLPLPDGARDEDNLVVRAYNLLARDYKLPRVHAHLYKGIPTQAGLGGGSADGAYMIKLLDERFRLNMGNAEMERYAARLGADCPFFITAEPCYATGRGDVLMPADNEYGNLYGYHLALVKPPVAVSTAEAYRAITPRKPEKSPRQVVRQPIATWRDELRNDFEEPVFRRFPQLAEIKQHLYDLGAAYAQMSGSGSAIYGIFRKRPDAEVLQDDYPDAFVRVIDL